MDRILISGVAGFLGYHLARLFLQENYQVIGVDNYLTGSRKNVTDLEVHENFSFLYHDVTKQLYLEEKC